MVGSAQVRHHAAGSGRTAKRAFTREELWNGNRAPLTNFYRWDPEKNLIRWAGLASTGLDLATTRSRYYTMSLDGTWSHATVLHLRTPAEVRAYERLIS